ncbi:hypothetical protein Y032_0003g1642 [Ancylostoma ceylanicum]|uniref:Uncharacterized protein n=1 Tax=Ancylostoma ceylanicum TaxID=53326 RepID=A0A016VYB1_9BILA|nr:hypothetical protein Y032_0003g1642 [Ancylostoma ceylanicum]
MLSFKLLTEWGGREKDPQRAPAKLTSNKMEKLYGRSHRSSRDLILFDTTPFYEGFRDEELIFNDGTARNVKEIHERTLKIHTDVSVQACR